MAAFSLLIVSTILISVKSLLVSIDQSKTTQITDAKMKKLAIAIVHFRMHNPNTALSAFTDLTVQPSGVPNCTFLDESSQFNASNLSGWCGPYIHTDFSGDTDSFGIDGWGNNMTFTVYDTGINHTNTTGVPTNLFIPPDLIDYFPLKNLAPTVYEQLIRFVYTLNSCGPSGVCGGSDAIALNF